MDRSTFINGRTAGLVTFTSFTVVYLNFIGYVLVSQFVINIIELIAYNGDVCLLSGCLNIDKTHMGTNVSKMQKAVSEARSCMFTNFTLN